MQNMCCLNRSLSLPLIAPPLELMQLYTANSPEAIHFRQNIRAYNHVFAFTSMGVNIDDTLANAMDGVYTYRAQGAIYHRIGSLLPEGGNRPRYMQMYIFDTDHELQHRMDENNLVNRLVLAILKQILDTYNPYVQVLRQISQHEQMQNIRLHIKELPPNERQYNMPTFSQVAAILVGEEDPNDRNDGDIIVQTANGDLLKCSRHCRFLRPFAIPSTSSSWEFWLGFECFR
ncbi:hypothetical protein AQUCO_00300145v1 [Aquilegia coerulea]|uniref:Helitron helicase-like domain-containing protein n=1 Tax=Aquilegia coerulea TaxID=218851 RepID=A0A2G5EXJ6_AQUCA|nr:hypothetical protein AQUCO_00300145v1 [Aquilegia coerulea]